MNQILQKIQIKAIKLQFRDDLRQLNQKKQEVNFIQNYLFQSQFNSEKQRWLNSKNIHFYKRSQLPASMQSAARVVQEDGSLLKMKKASNTQEFEEDVSLQNRVSKFSSRFQGSSPQLPNFFEQQESQIQNSSCNNNNNANQPNSAKSGVMQIIFNMKLKMLALRLANQLKSRMFSNMSLFQHKLIDDKSYAFHYIKPSQSQPKKNKNFRSQFQSRQETTRALTFKNLMSDQIQQEDQYQENQSENRFFLFQLLERSNLTSEIGKFLHSISLIIPLFHPTSVFKIFWDFLSMCMIALFLVQIPIYITFSDEINSRMNNILTLLAPIYVLFDTLININSSYYEKGVLIKRRTFILINYWKKYSAIEIFILSIYIIHILGVYSSGYQKIWTRFLLLIFIFKIKHCASIFHKFEETFISRRSHQIMDLAKLISVIMIIGHFISCLWLIIAQIETELGAQMTWISKREIEGNKWYFLYIEAFYFSMVTMVTVGYGDVLPITPIEKTTCVFLMLVSCGIFAYSMNTIGNILENFNQEEFNISQKMHIISTYMSNKNVNKQMQYSIREYLDYYWREASERDQDSEQKIIDQLSDQLKENLLIEANKIVLNARIKQRIIPLIREYRCTPEEIICSEGDADDFSIFFIEKGVTFLFLKEQKPLITLQKGSCFGELSFFTGFPRRGSVRSKEFTTLLMIKRENFIELLKDFPEDKEQFMAIKDSINLYEEYKILDLRCYSCKSSQHLVYDCPYIHFKSNKEKIIFLHNKSSDQERQQSYQRSINKKLNILQEGLLFHAECTKNLIDSCNDHPNILIYGNEHIPTSYSTLFPSRTSKVQLSIALPSSENMSLNSSSCSEKEETYSPSIKKKQRKQARIPSQIPDNDKNIENSKHLQFSQMNLTQSKVSEELSGNFFNIQKQRAASRRVTNSPRMAEVKEQEENEEKMDNNFQSFQLKQINLEDLGFGGSLIGSPVRGASQIISDETFQKGNLSYSQTGQVMISTNFTHRNNMSRKISQKMEASSIQKNGVGQSSKNTSLTMISRKGNEMENSIAEILRILKGKQSLEEVSVQPRRTRKLGMLPLKKNSSNNSNSFNSNLKSQSNRRESESNKSILPFYHQEYKGEENISSLIYDEDWNLTNYLNGFGESIAEFDSMKNFEIYFPFNNISYQLKLMNIGREEKKSQMFKTHQLNQQTMKLYVDSPTINKKGGFNKSSIQKVASKYQKEKEELDNLFGMELKKSKFLTSTKIPFTCGSENQEESKDISQFKTLNLINLQRRAISCAANIRKQPSSQFKNLDKNIKQTHLILLNEENTLQEEQNTIEQNPNDQKKQDESRLNLAHSNLDTNQMFDNKLSIEFHFDQSPIVKNSHTFLSKNKNLMLQEVPLSKSQGILNINNELDKDQLIFLYPNYQLSEQQQTNQEILPLTVDSMTFSEQKTKRVQDESIIQDDESMNILNFSRGSVQNINTMNTHVNWKLKRKSINQLHQLSQENYD